MTVRTLSIACHTWPLAKPFVIARGIRTETSTVTVTIEEEGCVGRGEAVASPRYGETDQSVVSQIEGLSADIEHGLSRDDLQTAIPPGAARNAIDCALWDLEAKRSGRDVGTLSSLRWPDSVPTVQTISILSPQEMFAEAQRLKNFPVLKVKLDADQIVERISAVRQGAPDATLLVDANESWSPEVLIASAPVLATAGVTMIEQPLPADRDEPLAAYSGPLPIFADESCHTRADLSQIADRYDGINIKLDKTGGLTEAIALLHDGRDRGLDVMVGCMVSSSLGIAPALFLASQAIYVDVDAPALLASDREFGLQIAEGRVSPLNPALWGGKL